MRRDSVAVDYLPAADPLPRQVVGQRIPDPTTAGDFCRRFGVGDVLDLMDAINDARARVWKLQPRAFFDEAVIDADGTLVATDAECKQGVDIAYDGTWGYHPLSSRWPTPLSRSTEGVPPVVEM